MYTEHRSFITKKTTGNKIANPNSYAHSNIILTIIKLEAELELQILMLRCLRSRTEENTYTWYY